MKKTVVIILAALMTALLAAGCGGKTEATVPETDPAVADEAVLQNALDLAFAPVTEQEEMEDYLAVLLERASYQVLEITELETDWAQARVKVSAPDLYSTVKALEGRTFETEAEADQAMA